MRPSFDQAAEQISIARDLIPADTPAEIFLHSAKPAAVSAWQSLDDHLATINSIASIAAQFGPRGGRFPLITEYSLGDNFRLDDKAILATNGDLVADSSPFGRPDQGHRSSPWFKVPLKLHTVASAQDRYRAWAASEFDRIHSSPATQWLDEHGQAHEMPKPTNPYAEVADASIGP